MPKRNDIKSILIIGAGPIVIGQGCEFDYSGTQACKALKEEGYRVILVNSNPATIMTDPELADATYIEPITPEMVEKIIAKERPDALLPTMGGQTGLNTALSLAHKGVLEKYGVKMIGATKEAIDKAEDRALFKTAMNKIGLNTPKSYMCQSIDDGMKAIEEIGLPMILRPNYTLGGTGGGIAYNKEEFINILMGGLDASPTSEVLVEQSVLGWKEYEMEVVRDKADNCIIICSIENVDPMGIHTGDSVTVAPALTLSDKEYQIMRNASIAVLREIGVETGGSNVQFAINPKNGEMIVIEMNPRVSRSSALASKATGFPIAKVAAKLAVGYTLDELDNDITGGATPASFEPTIDYVVTKIPRFTFEKFEGADPSLTTSMKSVGEAMAIGRNFQESLQKALRSTETGLTGLDDVYIKGWTANGDDAPDIKNIDYALAKPSPDRLLTIAEALRAGLSVNHIAKITKFDPWFIRQVKELVNIEKNIKENGVPQDASSFLELKIKGFSDERIAQLTGSNEAEVSAARRKLDVRPVYKRIDTCAAEFEAQTPYFYSTYEHPSYKYDGKEVVAVGVEDESKPTDKKKVIILGGGPNRIGQGIEFDYCCCHACFSLSDQGIETIMVNCNPETVSTDYDTSDRLYFEPLTAEDVTELISAEQKSGELLGVIVQFGGQTPLKLANALEAAGIPILGTSPDALDLAEDRERFQELVEKLGLRQPNNGIARSTEEAQAIAEKIGFPVLIRPSHVLGGRAMEIVHDMKRLNRYMKEAVKVSGDSPVLIDSYLSNAIEIDVDALSDGKDVFIAGIMQHIEEAGIHSGDSTCTLPPYSLKPSTIAELEKQTRQLAIALNVVGLMNIQFAVQNDDIYLIEVNPRASRTVPFVAKTIGLPVAKIASRLMVGEKLADFDLTQTLKGHTAIKSPVFPFERFAGVDILLGPEMRSTGEVMGLDQNFEAAFIKSQLAKGLNLPLAGGNLFISIKDSDKEAFVEPVKELIELGYKITATAGTADFFTRHGLDITTINKVVEGRPHVVDAMKDGSIDLVLNTTEGLQSIKDSYSLRRSALMEQIPYYTTLAGSLMAMRAMKAQITEGLEVASLQSYSNRNTK